MDRYERAVYGAPPPPRERKPCRLCGEFNSITNVAVEGERFDSCCWQCANFARCLPALGHAIARFVRAAEVTTLRTQIVERMQHSGLCGMAGKCVCEIDEAYRAIDVLARLAGEVSGG